MILMYQCIYFDSEKVFSFVLVKIKLWTERTRAHSRKQSTWYMEIEWKSHRSTYGATFRMLVIHKRYKLPHSLPVSRYAVTLCLRLCSFLLFRMQFLKSFSVILLFFSMRFASFIAIFGDVSFGCHTMFTQIDLYLVFIVESDGDFPTNIIICPMSQLTNCMLSIDRERSMGYKQKNVDTKFQIWLQKMLNKMLQFVAQNLFLWKLIKYANRNLLHGIFNRLWVCKVCIGTSTSFTWHISNAMQCIRKSWNRT